MKSQVPKIIEQGRIILGRKASTSNDGFNGAFIIKGPKGNLTIISSTGMGWEHVSISVEKSIYKVPSWKEMCFVKDLFWNDDEWVVQFHPAKAEYVNNHPSVLHLWKPVDVELPKPQSILVGIKELGTLA